MPAFNMPLNLEELLDGIDLPATKPEIIAYAEDNGASEEALNLLQALPDRDFHSFVQLNNDLGLIERQPGEENLWSSADYLDLDNGRQKHHAPDYNSKRIDQ